ncbi:MAG: hypothetical protein AB1716_18920, partial [Planctomycetota bacterium]
LAPGGDVRFGFVWSPDGTRLVFRADKDTDDVLELYVGAAGGGATTKVNGPLTPDGDVGGFAWSPLSP